jgi:hypothetical protein
MSMNLRKWCFKLLQNIEVSAQFRRPEKSLALCLLCGVYNHSINLPMTMNPFSFSRSSSDTERGTSKTSRSLYRELASVRRRIEDMEQQFVLRTGYRPSQVAGHHTYCTLTQAFTSSRTSYFLATHFLFNHIVTQGFIILIIFHIKVPHHAQSLIDEISDYSPKRRR